MNDTPGLEIFALWEITPDNLRDCFPEFAGPAEKCKYRDCSHTMEPKCGVREAVSAGSIATSRHVHYTAIRKTLVDQHKLFA